MHIAIVILCGEVLDYDQAHEIIVEEAWVYEFHRTQRKYIFDLKSYIIYKQDLSCIKLPGIGLVDVGSVECQGLIKISVRSFDGSNSLLEGLQ